MQRICTCHRVFKSKSRQHYTIGQKRCKVCQILINWEGPWCPCCGYRLRGKTKT